MRRFELGAELFGVRLVIAGSSRRCLTRLRRINRTHASYIHWDCFSFIRIILPYRGDGHIDRCWARNIAAGGRGRNLGGLRRDTFFVGNLPWPRAQMKANGDNADAGHRDNDRETSGQKWPHFGMPQPYHSTPFFRQARIAPQPEGRCLL
jgi:hypothetical protein